VTEEPDAEVTLLDDAGVERRFVLHDAFDADGRTYYLVESLDDPEQVLLLGDTEDGLESVSQEEFDRVLALLEAEDEGVDE
jgi:diaminopimelate decarboxylase